MKARRALRRWSGGRWDRQGSDSFASLRVLDLLADFFQLRFGGDDVVGDLGVVALGAPFRLRLLRME